MNWIVKFVVIAMCTTLLVACGDGSSAPPTVDVTGTWKGTVRNQAGKTGAITLTFKQTGADVSGSLAAPANKCITNAAISGAVSGSEFNGQVRVGDIKLTYKGTVIGDAMSGTYELVSGPCGVELGTYNVSR